MPTLVQSLQGRDLGHLRIVAGLWGVELAPAEHEAALQELTTALSESGPDPRDRRFAFPRRRGQPLERLVEAGGKIPWAAFARQFGEIRETGPGRRDREQVYLNPVSIAETLFYRAFLARAFFDTPNGAQEFAYIPDDLLDTIKHTGCLTQAPSQSIAKPPTGNTAGSNLVYDLLMREEAPGRPATPKEHQHILPATDRLLDDATTFLAALRMGHETPETADTCRDSE